MKSDLSYVDFTVYRLDNGFEIRPALDESYYKASSIEKVVRLLVEGFSTNRTVYRILAVDVDSPTDEGHAVQLLRVWVSLHKKSQTIDDSTDYSAVL